MNKSVYIKILIIFLVHINASAIEKVVLFGDSLMAGYGLPKEHHLSIVLEKNLKQADFNIKVINWYYLINFFLIWSSQDAIISV